MDDSDLPMTLASSKQNLKASTDSPPSHSTAVTDGGSDSGLLMVEPRRSSVFSSESQSLKLMKSSPLLWMDKVLDTDRTHLVDSHLEDNVFDCEPPKENAFGALQTHSNLFNLQNIPKNHQPNSLPKHHPVKRPH